MAGDPTDLTDLAALRREYGEAGLDEGDVDADPWLQWRRWFDDAIAAAIHEPNAMVVATVDADGSPSARTVLLKGAVPAGASEGFRFFTNTASRKGRDIAGEPRVALLFPWHAVQRQVRVEGVAHRLGDAEVAAYFASRPREAQLGAWASPQSAVVPDRATLDARYRAAELRFEDADVPVPDGWGGYRVVPEVFEFWQGRVGRLHDRLRHRRTPTGWALERLAP